jgi:replicative DNA helicase
MNDENDKLRSGQLPSDPLEGVTVSDDVPRIHTVQELLQSSMSRATMRERRSFGTSGHSCIDEATGGLRPGDVWLLGADTSPPRTWPTRSPLPCAWGKSSWAILIADENIKRKKRVLIVAAEDSESTYGDRLMRRRSGVAADRLRHRLLTSADLDAMTAVLAKGEPLPVFIDARGRSVEWLAPRCKRAIVEHAIDIVVFDYIGAFVGKLQQQDKRNMVHYIGRVLTDIAKTATAGGISGVILSQLTPAGHDAIPDKYAIRDSKDLTQMAEVTLIGFYASTDRPKYGIKKGDRCIKLAKVKEGAAGANVRMSWNNITASFDAVYGDEWGSWDNE